MKNNRKDKPKVPSEETFAVKPMCLIWTPTLKEQLETQLLKMQQFQEDNQQGSLHDEGFSIAQSLFELINEVHNHNSSESRPQHMTTRHTRWGDFSYGNTVPSAKVNKLLKAVRLRNSQFQGYNQQDSFEMFNTIISGIEEEMFTFEKSIDSTEQTHDERVFNLCPVSKLYGGMFITMYSYSTCKHIEPVFQRFTSVCIPVPDEISPEEDFPSYSGHASRKKKVQRPKRNYKKDLGHQETFHNRSPNIANDDKSKWTADESLLYDQDFDNLFTVLEREKHAKKDHIEKGDQSKTLRRAESKNGKETEAIQCEKLVKYDAIEGDDQSITLQGTKSNNGKDILVVGCEKVTKYDPMEEKNQNLISQEGKTENHVQETENEQFVKNYLLEKEDHSKTLQLNESDNGDATMCHKNLAKNDTMEIEDQNITLHEKKSKTEEDIVVTEYKELTGNCPMEIGDDNVTIQEKKSKNGEDTVGKEHNLERKRSNRIKSKDNNNDEKNRNMLDISMHVKPMKNTSNSYEQIQHNINTKSKNTGKIQNYIDSMPIRKTETQEVSINLEQDMSIPEAKHSKHIRFEDSDDDIMPLSSNGGDCPMEIIPSQKDTESVKVDDDRRASKKRKHSEIGSCDDCHYPSKRRKTETVDLDERETNVYSLIQGYNKTDTKTKSTNARRLSVTKHQNLLRYKRAAEKYKAKRLQSKTIDDGPKRVLRSNDKMQSTTNCLDSEQNDEALNRKISLENVVFNEKANENYRSNDKHNMYDCQRKDHQETDASLYVKHSCKTNKNWHDIPCKENQSLNPVNDENKSNVHLVTNVNQCEDPMNQKFLETLSLEPDNGFQFRIEKGLKELTKIETFPSKDLPCRKCTKAPDNGYCYKRLMIMSPPPVLALQINRFKQSGNFGQLQKIQSDVSYPEILNLSPFVSQMLQVDQPNVSKVQYSLYGVVCHNGGLHGGHYYAYIKTTPRNKSLLKQHFLQQRWSNPEELSERIIQFCSKETMSNESCAYVANSNAKESGSKEEEEHREDKGSSEDTQKLTRKFKNDKDKLHRLHESIDKTDNQSDVIIDIPDDTKDSDLQSLVTNVTTNCDPVWYYISDSLVLDDNNALKDPGAYILMYERIQ